MEEKIIFTTEDVTQNKVFGILAYIGLLVLVPIFAAKDSPYARFHANQGLILFICSVILSVFTSLVRFSLFFLPVLSVIANVLLSLATGAFSLTFMIIGIINACSGEAKKLPLIGNFTLLK